jgi:hypothetical protein
MRRSEQAARSTGRSEREPVENVADQSGVLDELFAGAPEDAVPEEDGVGELAAPSLPDDPFSELEPLGVEPPELESLDPDPSEPEVLDPDVLDPGVLDADEEPE